MFSSEIRLEKFAPLLTVTEPGMLTEKVIKSAHSLLKKVHGTQAQQLARVYKQNKINI